MNINTKQILQGQLQYEGGEHRFLLDGESVHFDEVEHFFQRITEHYQYSVYTGKTVNLHLVFYGDRPSLQIEAKTPEYDVYGVVFRLSEFLADYRFQKMQKIHQQGECLSFSIRQKRFRYYLTLQSEDLTFVEICPRLDLPDEHQRHKVEQILLQDSIFRFCFAGGGSKTVPSAAIADVSVFFVLISATPLLCLFPEKKNPRFERACNIVWLLLLLLFALNGWFEFCCMDLLWIQLPSVLAKIIVMIGMILTPVSFFVTNPFNSRSKAREAEHEKTALTQSGTPKVSKGRIFGYLVVPIWFILVLLVIGG